MNFDDLEERGPHWSLYLVERRVMSSLSRFLLFLLIMGSCFAQTQIEAKELTKKEIKALKRQKALYTNLMVIN